LQSRPVTRNEDDSPLVVWLSAIGGGLALVLVISLIVYNAARRPVPQLAATATNNPAPATPVAVTTKNPAPHVVPTPLPPLTATVPVAAQVPANTAATEPAQQANSFPPPGYGGMMTTPDGNYEVWLPSAAQKFDPSLDLAAFLPKPKGAQALIAFGKQGPTEICSVSITPGATAAEMYAQMEHAFPGEPETKSMKFAGVDARQYDFFIELTEGKFAIRTVAFVVDGNGVTLQTLSMTGQKETDETRVFFASFRKKKSDQ
jgi:hypothetical protein